MEIIGKEIQNLQKILINNLLNFKGATLDGNGDPHMVKIKLEMEPQTGVQLGDFLFAHLLYNSLQFVSQSQTSLKLIVACGYGLSGRHCFHRPFPPKAKAKADYFFFLFGEKIFFFQAYSSFEVS